MGRRVRHSREFKLEAVRLFELDQKPASELALELGIRRNQLYKWKNSLEAKARRPSRSGPQAGIGRERSRASEARA